MTKNASLTVRTSPANRELLEKLGRNNMSDGFEKLCKNYQDLIKVLTPTNFSEEEIQCIAGCCNGYMVDNIKHLNKMLGFELEDYFELNPLESGQFKVDKAELIEKVDNLSGPETFALIQKAGDWFYAHLANFKQERNELSR